jgi:hypothetical protein
LGTIPHFGKIVFPTENWHMCEFCKPFIINALRVWHTVGYLLFKPTTQNQTLKPNLNLIVAQTMKKITKFLTATALIIVAATTGSYA